MAKKKEEKHVLIDSVKFIIVFLNNINAKIKITKLEMIQSSKFTSMSFKVLLWWQIIFKNVLWKDSVLHS